MHRSCFTSDLLYKHHPFIFPYGHTHLLFIIIISVSLYVTHRGTPDGFYVTEQYTVPFEGFSTLATGATTMKNNKTTNGIITTDVIERLQINEKNVTVPIALMLFDIETYPSLSRARKYCRYIYLSSR